MPGVGRVERTRIELDSGSQNRERDIHQPIVHTESESRAVEARKRFPGSGTSQSLALPFLGKSETSSVGERTFLCGI